jgi:hypothetical protein
VQGLQGAQFHRRLTQLQQHYSVLPYAQLLQEVQSK